MAGINGGIENEGKYVGVLDSSTRNINNVSNDITAKLYNDQ